MKQNIAKLVSKITGLDEKEVEKSIEVPKDPSLGDFAFPCFLLAKQYKKNPVEIAKEISAKITEKSFEKIVANGPYINFFIERLGSSLEVLNRIKKEKGKYGSNNTGKKKIIVVEMSSPNIAKPFGIGHLRSTIIGNSIANLSEFNGYDVKRINYLGDWGTQFGKLILGYLKFGNEKELKKDPINHLLQLYVKVSEKEEYEEEARKWFKNLEDGNKIAVNLWKKFRAFSIKDFNAIYKQLGIKFDEISGESVYRNKMDSTISLLDKKGLLKNSDGAKVVDLEKYNLGVCLIEKSDGATLYATRDLTAALDRQKRYKFDKMFYEVGAEQTLHFRQIFKILELLGFSWAKECKHISHGLYLDSDGKRFRTRKGKTVFMQDILNETFELAKAEIRKRGKVSEKELEKRARAISLAAIFYGDLKNFRVNDVLFDLERFVSFEGDTGPYLLYSYARAKSILRKKILQNKFSIDSLNEKEKILISELGKFPEIVAHAYSNLSPNIVANYSFKLCQTFNEFYHSNQVIGSENEKSRLQIVDAFSQVLKNSLTLLGIPILEKM